MNEYELAIILPSRNEMFLARTIQDILENKEAKTEIIAVLDGEWADPPIPQHPDVNVIYVPESIGQRAATNLGVRLTKAHWVMKVDAHCSFDKGFDSKMLDGFKIAGDNVTMVPVMKNLHAFNWVCKKCGSRRYQGDSHQVCSVITDGQVVPNPNCDGTEIEKELVWMPRANVNNGSFCFDKEPHFQYFGEYKHRIEYQKDKRRTRLTESMGLQGSCFMATKEKYFELELCGENLGSWGNQGIEIACKTWLSGGRVLCNHNTWYAHMFRTQKGDWNFPYLNRGSHILKTKQRTWEQIVNKQCPKQIHPVSWLVEKFWPVPGWTGRALNKLKEYEKSN